MTASMPNLSIVLNAAAEIERKSEVDAYLVAYWIYKHKMSFTTGDRTHLRHSGLPKPAQTYGKLPLHVMEEYLSTIQ